MDMELELTKRPKNVILIEGFPGFGLIGTITTEFLIEHLKAEQIGRIKSNELTPLVAIHDSEVIEPLGIFYSEKYNIVILHALTSLSGLEWKLGDVINELCKQLQVKEVVSIEGVGTPLMEEVKTINPYYYSKTNSKKFESIGVKPLKEGIVIGVTGALLLNIKSTPLSCIFVETHSKLPDSRGAAKVIEVLDKYLGLKIDYKPLLKKAEQFEKKLAGLIEQSQTTSVQQKEKELSYLG